MKRFPHLFRSLLCLAALAAAAACSDDNDSPEAAEPNPGTETQFGTYEFDGVEYPIRYACYTDSENYTAFVFSPLKERPLTTSLTFSIENTFLGEEYEVGPLGIYHNDDYFLIYEDPVHYYSQYRELKGGTVRVERNTEQGENRFTIRLDVQLNDGTPLKLDFEGELPRRTALDDE